MHCRSVWQKYNAQIPAVHLRDACPKSKAAIILNRLAHRIINDVLNPLQTNHRPVRSLAHCLEIAGELHGRNRN